MVSALKVGGRRLHELARAGVEVERPARTVVVDRFDVEETSEPGVLAISVSCSAGTYVRSLAADLGAALGGGAHLRRLRRTRIGSFGADEAQQVSQLDIEDVLTPAQGLRDLTQVVLAGDVAGAVSHGRALDKVEVGAPGEGPWAVLDDGGDLLAVYVGGDTDRMVAACVLHASV